MTAPIAPATRPDEAPDCIYCDDTGIILDGDTERPCGSCYEPPWWESEVGAPGEVRGGLAHEPGGWCE